MQKSIRTALLSAVFMCLPAVAVEVGVLVDKQFGSSQSTTIPGAGTVNWDAVNPSGFGIRVAFPVAKLPGAEVGLDATYRFEGKTDLNGSGQGGSYRIGEQKLSYVALGITATARLPLELQGGLELRQESLQLLAMESGATSKTTSHLRPWLRGGLGYAMPSPGVKPFIRFEAAFALANSGKVDIHASDDDANKAFAPRYQLALVGGIRF